MTPLSIQLQAILDAQKYREKALKVIADTVVYLEEIVKERAVLRGSIDAK